METHDPEDTLTVQVHNTGELVGHDHWVLGDYVDRFWTPVVGPTATILMRRVISDAKRESITQLNYTFSYLAWSIGRQRATGSISKSLARLQAYRLVHINDYGIATFLTHLPSISPRSQARLHRVLLAEHDMYLSDLGVPA